MGWGSQKDICGERRPWKLEEYKVYVCVCGLRSTSFVLGVAKKSEVPICSARPSLTYPSRFCQAGTRTTAGDPWLCKLQRNKHELPVNTPSPKYAQAFSTSNITASQRTKTIFFLIVPPQYYWPLLHVCRFLYSLNKKVTGQTISSRSLKNNWVRIIFVWSTPLRANSPTPTGELAYVGEFDQRHRRVRCL